MNVKNDNDEARSFEPDRLAAELAALGEVAPDADELQWLSQGAGASDHDDLLAVRAMFDLGHADARMAHDREFGADAVGLDELARRRTWQTVVKRAGLGGPSRRAVWRSVLVGLAMAAGVALVPTLAGPNLEPSPRVDPVLMDALARQARHGLEAIDAPLGAERARALANDYAARLRAERSGEERP